MLVTFEGIEGSGKSTQAKLLYDRLKDLGVDCILTKEPGATYIGQKIREILLIPQKERITKDAELFLYLADRAQHIEHVIKPALKEKKIVIVDRFTDSTIAYQGYGRGISIEFLEMLNKKVTDNIEPDITFLLDLDPEEGLRRAKARNTLNTKSSLEVRFEEEKIEFHKRVREGYLNILKRFPDRVVLLDGKKDVYSLSQEVFLIFKTKANL